MDGSRPRDTQFDGFRKSEDQRYQMERRTEYKGHELSQFWYLRLFTLQRGGKSKRSFCDIGSVRFELH